MRSATKVEQLINSYSPGLFENIKKNIEESERKFDGDNKSSYLWEHTEHVTSIAYSIAVKENVDPLPVIITSLFHDSGKFIQGEYHKEDKPEEEESIIIAEEILNKFFIEDKMIKTVTGSLRSLYNEKIEKNVISKIIHDADFLSKSGPLGIAVYFTKSVLRKKNIVEWLTGSASKELTYANYLPANMYTAGGKEYAESDKIYTVRFFENLFNDLKKKGIEDFIIKNFKIFNRKCNKEINLSLAYTKECGKCGGEFNINFLTEEGLKCEKLKADVTCISCNNSYSISFCLPEICRNPPE